MLIVTPRPRPATATVEPDAVKPPAKPEKPPTQLASLPPAGEDNPGSCSRSLASLGIDAHAMPAIHDGLCGVSSPTAVASLDNGAVTLTEKAIVNCAVAGALASWMDKDVEPAAKRILGGGVTSLRIAASYDCRGRNNIPGAQLSEHAFGNAVDISAFKVAGLGWVEVGHTKSAAEAEFLKAIRGEACGPFTTVLGPGVPYHDEHFHLDLARRGKNKTALYCK